MNGEKRKKKEVDQSKEKEIKRNKNKDKHNELEQLFYSFYFSLYSSFHHALSLDFLFCRF